MAPALGGEGLAMLKTRLEAESTTPSKASDRKVIAITTRGPIQREDFEARYKARRIQSALTDIADALGDADGYAARYSDEERSNPAIAAQIAERLLRADRPDDAMAALELAEPQTRAARHYRRCACRRGAQFDARGPPLRGFVSRPSPYGPPS
jgi:hypothetical protein